MTSTIVPRLIELASRATGTTHKSPYGYTPTLWICILFVTLFGVTTALHLVQALYVKPRLYWLIPTMVFCGLCEAIGWAARVWSSKSPSKVDPFLMQITTTIIAPTFLTAALYTILGRIITILGHRYSRLKPKAYIITFLTADIVALVVQAVGGAKASLAFQSGKDATPGSHIMLAGIFLQMVGIVIYLLLMTEFLLRFHLQRPLHDVKPSYSSASSVDVGEEREKVPNMEIDRVLEGRGVMSRNIGLMVIALVLSTLLVLVRTIYRTIELLGGWRGRIITTEKYFNILDGAPIVLAMFIFNFLHPGILLRNNRGRTFPVIA